MKTVDRYTDHPVCAKGLHDLSSVRSYKRTRVGRVCRECAEPGRAQRLQRRRAQRGTYEERITMQLLGCAESIRITTEQAKARNAA